MVGMCEASFRWLVHHSAMSAEFGDAVIIGASSEDHLRQNIASLRQGPLDDEVVAAFDAAWTGAKLSCPSYYR